MREVKPRWVFWWIIFPISFIAYVLAWLAPATLWYQPGFVHIQDGQAGSDPLVQIERVIKHDFDGRYTVSIWSVPPEADGHVACAGSDYLRYKGGLFKPHSTTLADWANTQSCLRVKPGVYYAEACWTVLHPFGGIVPSKTVCVSSNVFTFFAKGQGTATKGATGATGPRGAPGRDAKQYREE